MRNAPTNARSRQQNSSRSLRRAAAAGCDQLETRQLFNTFNYAGTAGPDVINIYIQQWQNTRTLDISINGVHQTANTPFITDVNIYGHGGNDTINVVQGSV